MALNINTDAPKYQNYLAGLEDLREDMIPRLKIFSNLSRERQTWWLQRDPLLRSILKLALQINKHLPIRQFREEV